MTGPSTSTRACAAGLAVVMVLGTVFVRGDDAATVSETAAETVSGATDSAAGQTPPRQLFRGRVVLLGDALRNRNLRAAEEMDTHVVLEADSGELIPILADWRGRAFYQDKRLRDRDVELVGFRQQGIPYLQVLMIFTFDEAQTRQYTDYWCDVCSIPMYEIKPCECCQGDIRLRFQQRDLPEYLREPAVPEAAPRSAADESPAP